MKLRSWLLPADSNCNVYPVLQAVEKDEAGGSCGKQDPHLCFFFFFQRQRFNMWFSLASNSQFIVLRTQIPECWDCWHVSPHTGQIEKNSGVIVGFNCITQGYR